MGIPGNDQILKNAEDAYAKSDNGSDYNPNVEEQLRDEESYKQIRKQIYGE